MAPPQILSRTQRRHEQKQTVLVLALVAVVALLSFLAGIMVGRGMSRPESAAVAVAPAPAPRLPVPAPPPTVATPTSAPALPAGGAPAAETTRADQLSFYDSLAKGEQPPLGSGINLPPPGAIPPPEPVADVVERPAPAAGTATAVKSTAPTGQAPVSAEKKPVIATKSPSPTSKTTTTTKAAVAPAAKADSKAAVAKSAVSTTSKVATTTGNKSAKAVASASYVIQAASYHKAQEAADLSRRLARKGYTPFVEAVDLGSKGQWHRVYVGPFSNVAAADKVAKRLKSEERLAPVVRKR